MSGWRLDRDRGWPVTDCHDPQCIPQVMTIDEGRIGRQEQDVVTGVSRPRPRISGELPDDGLQFDDGAARIGLPQDVDERVGGLAGPGPYSTILQAYPWAFTADISATPAAPISTLMLATSGPPPMNSWTTWVS
jgi:hypothetical protein